MNAIRQLIKKVNTWKLNSKPILLLILLTLLACKEEKFLAQDSIDPPAEREVFTVVEEQPSYEGGMDSFYKFLMEEVRYPVEARNNGIEGEVHVQFTIERNASVTDVQIIKDIGSGCGSEVEKNIKKLTSFKAGSQRGRTVKTMMILPVNFKLDPTKTNTDNSPHGSIVFGELQMKKKQFQLDVEYVNGAWQGMLKDDDNKALPGANILIEGTNYGTVSDVDGTFSIVAQESQNVSISYIGYESIKLTEEE